MQKKPVPIQYPHHDTGASVTYQMPTLWGNFSDHRISTKGKGDHFSIILHLAAKFGFLDAKMVYQLFIPRIRAGFRKQLMYQKKGKLFLTPEGSELEQLLEDLGRFVFRRCQLGELNFHDRILYLLLYPDMIEEYDLYHYYLMETRTQNGARTRKQNGATLG